MSFVISLLVYFSNEYANVFSTFTLVVFNQDLCKSPKLGIWAFLCFCSLNDNPLHILIIASLQSTCSLWRVTNSRFCRWYFFYSATWLCFDSGGLHQGTWICIFYIFYLHCEWCFISLHWSSSYRNEQGSSFFILNADLIHKGNICKLLSSFICF